MSSVLAGVRVLDCSTGLAGPLAAMCLADFGADVVEVEPPGRDPARREPGFAVWSRGKRGVIVDAATAEGSERLDALLSGADVVVANASREALCDTPLDPGGATASNPRLVYLHVPPYLDAAPWEGEQESSALLAAYTGVALRQASFDGGPVDSIYPHVTTVQGLWAAACATAALIERERSGRGQVVTVAGIHGVLVAGAGGLTFDPVAAAEAARRRAPGGPGGSVPFYRTYRCADGEWLFLAALTPRFTEAAFRVLGVTALLDDPRLEGRGRAGLLQPNNLGWVIDHLAAVFATRPREEWLRDLNAAGCPAGPLLERDDWLDHPQLAAIGMRVEVDDPDRGRVVMPGTFLNLTATPAVVRGAAPPEDATSQPITWRSAPRAAGQDPIERSARAEKTGPLAGVRVLDLGAIIAGPFAASLLADLGADVVKVEPLSGDSFRGPGFAAYNKGQRGLAVDLRHADGRDVLLDLVRTADVVIDNYRPGVLGRLRITHDDLRAVNPRIISVSVTGFGEGGPLGHEAGFDPVLQAMSGMMRAQGGDSDPVFFTVPVNDVAASATAALGACLALLHRQRSGEGQRVWTSLAAMSALLQADALVRFDGRRRAPVGGRDHRGPAPDNRYVEDGDGWVRVEGAARVRARRTHELAADEDLRAYGVLHDDPRPGRGGWVTPGRHARFSRTELAGTLVAPALGEHTREVLLEAGVDPDRVEALLAAGILKQDAAETARQGTSA